MIVLEDLVVVLEGSAVALGHSAEDSAAALEGTAALGTMGDSGVF